MKTKILHGELGVLAPDCVGQLHLVQINGVQIKYSNLQMDLDLVADGFGTRIWSKTKRTLGEPTISLRKKDRVNQNKRASRCNKPPGKRIVSCEVESSTRYGAANPGQYPYRVLVYWSILCLLVYLFVFGFVIMRFL